MRPEEIKSFLGSHWESVEGYISSSLSSDIMILQKVNESILANSGKQLRPMLSLLVAMACSEGRPTENTYRFAAASELLHNATLLHDDVADSSDERRGVPTIRSLMGPSVSVLLGDYWLVKAMELILSGGDDGRVVRIFSRTLSDLAEGEMLQLQKAGTGDTDEGDYTEIIYKKTASLFVAASLSAAISVGADAETEQAVADYAKSLGLAFQIKDDIFDYSLSQEVGKPTGVDIMEQKITLPLLGAFESVSSQKEQYIRSLVSDICNKPENKNDILDFVRDNQGLEYAEKRLGEYVEQAIRSIEVLSPSPYRDLLADLAIYAGKRTK